MTNEDVLEKFVADVCRYDHLGPDANSVPISIGSMRAAVYHIATLAAEVRELRKDRERLDWLESCVTITTGTDHGCVQIGTCRSNIDAAMKERSE